MMNKSVDLTSAKTDKVAQYGAFLSGVIGHKVSVNYRKRDGQPGEGSGQFRTLVGECVEVRGESDKAVVVIALADGSGFRSANLSNILHARLAD